MTIGYIIVIVLQCGVIATYLAAGHFMWRRVVLRMLAHHAMQGDVWAADALMAFRFHRGTALAFQTGVVLLWPALFLWGVVSAAIVDHWAQRRGTDTGV